MAATEQEKRAKNRKDLIKNILIVFLVIMLLLTFFSGTIQNWSLPEVATAYVQQGSVSPQIRGSGTVQADDPYNVTPEETRKIASVAVKVGDKVVIDDVIYYLEDGDSTELEEESLKLRDMETAFEVELLTGDLDDATITRIRNGQVGSVSSYQGVLSDINARYNDAVAVDESLKSALEVLEAELAIKLADLGYADTSALTYSTAEAEAENATLSAEEARLQSEITILQSQYDTKYAADPADPDLVTISDQITEKQARLTQIAARKQTLQGIIAANAQSAAVQTEQAAQEKEKIEREFNARRADLQAQKTNSAQRLAEITKEREEKIAAIKAELSFSTQLRAIAEQRKKVERLQEKGSGAAVKSPVEGTVTQLQYAAGQTMNAGETAAVIQVAGKAMTLEITVTADQAKSLKVGDFADPQDSWRYSEFKATLVSLRPDPNDPSGSRIAVFSIDSPEVQAGQTVNIKIGESQRNYDMTVPNSAIREDNNGKFILIVQSRSSPLRNRYIAQRVDVDVIAQDDTTSAISAAIEGYEYVITTASAPISAGQEVRLANN